MRSICAHKQQNLKQNNDNGRKLIGSPPHERVWRITCVRNRGAGSGKPPIALVCLTKDSYQVKGQRSPTPRAWPFVSQTIKAPLFPPVSDLSREVFVPISTKRKAIAPLQRLRRLFNQDHHVSSTAGLAREPDRNKTEVVKPGGLDQDHSIPSGPPSARNVISAADGAVLGEVQLRHLVNEVKDYQITHGSMLKLVKHETQCSVPTRGVGISLLPTPFPRECFQHALDLQEAFNELYVRVSSDPDWLYGILEPLIENDAFISALWNVYVHVRDASALQSVVSGVFRSDYMLHEQPELKNPTLKQVEINTFSAAGACHAERVANMHHRIGQMRGLAVEKLSHHLPENHNTSGIVTSLKTAHDIYSSTVSPDSSRPKCVLMTVQPFNFNIADERPIQYGLWDVDIPCYRCEWQTVLNMTTLTADRTLSYRPAVGETEYEVSVIYYRGGYEAAEYREQSKETRLRLEMSRAVKCPDILVHLTTCKAVQEALCTPGVLERFLSPEKVDKVRSTFMYMQSLDNSPAGKEAQAISLDPGKAVNYVLKPNRDGGGHNVYRAKISNFLKSKAPKFWKNYVLMRLIQPPAAIGTLMVPENLYHGPVISELGVVGACLWNRSDGTSVEMLANDVAGWTFKTKPANVDEMSVVKGYGCFDCPWLS